VRGRPAGDGPAVVFAVFDVFAIFAAFARDRGVAFTGE
jgi:hypothetical protein